MKKSVKDWGFFIFVWLLVVVWPAIRGYLVKRNISLSLLYVVIGTAIIGGGYYFACRIGEKLEKKREGESK